MKKNNDFNQRQRKKSSFSVKREVECQENKKEGYAKETLVSSRVLHKKAQQEMVGFGLIIIIVAVIILVFLTISLRKTSQEVESYEVDSFLQALSQYTTNCSVTSEFEYLEIKDLIQECYNGKTCVGGASACEVLNQTLNVLLSNSWQIGENRPNKGYFFNSTYEGQEIISLEQGNTSLRNTKGASQNFEKLDLYFKIYS